MIVEETYRPCFRELQKTPLYSRDTGPVEVEWIAAATRTGSRGEALKHEWPEFINLSGPQAFQKLLDLDLDAVCIATPDDRHFDVAKRALSAGRHVLIEKPSVLNVAQLDELITLASQKNCLAKVVYHKLFDPDHKKLRTLVVDGVLNHVNNGYCSLLEPKSIATGQFAEWIHGRNPASYVAVHYLKLLDFSFGPHWTLMRISATGQRGIVAANDSKTWDSVQMQVVYKHHNSHREAAFDIHTSWVTPDNFPGYVEQEVQFRFDNGVWAASQRKRGVELTVEGRTPNELKNTPNYHYNGQFLEPDGQRSQRGYGLEAIRNFFEQVAFVRYGPGDVNQRIHFITHQRHNDLSADRNVIIAIEAVESILAAAADGRPGGIVMFRDGRYQLSLP
jgi:D-galacturonate reductase